MQGKTKRVLGVLLVIGFLFEGCSTGPTRPIQLSEEFIKEIPTELKEKFEVKDAPETPELLDRTASSVASEPVNLKTPLSKTKKSSSKLKKKVELLQPAFEYPKRRSTKDAIW